MLALHLWVNYPVAVDVVFWIIGVVLLLTLPKKPVVPMTACPICGASTVFRVQRPCLAWWVFLLLIILSPVGVVVILVMRSRIRLRCHACRGAICGSVKGAAITRMTQAALATPPLPDTDAEPFTVAATAATVEACATCGCALGILEPPHHWREHTVCHRCLETLQAADTIISFKNS